MKFLIIEEELEDKKALLRILSKYGDCQLATTGDEGFEIVRTALEAGTPFDVITIDISEPPKGGNEVLSNIRELERASQVPEDDRAMVLITTAKPDKETLLTSMQLGCDGYLIKPFNLKIIISKIKEFEAKKQANATKAEQAKVPEPVEEPLNDKVSIGLEVVRRFGAGEFKMSPPSQILFEFQDLMKRNPSYQQIAEILKKDIVLSMHLISLSNSTYYRGITENRTTLQAISRLGLEVTKRQVDIVCNRSIYSMSNKRFSSMVEKLWEHTLSCAHASEIVANLIKLPLKYDPFTISLLHDVGKLALIQIVGDMDAVGKIGLEVDMNEVWATVFEFHGKFGAMLLKKWEFPREYANVALHHDNLSEMANISNELYLVNFCNMLVKKLGFGYRKMDDINLEELLSTKYLKLDSTQIKQVMEQVKARMNP